MPSTKLIANYERLKVQLRKRWRNSSPLQLPLINGVYGRIYAAQIERRAEELQKRLPPQVLIETLNVCNADCIMCPYSSMERSKGVMDMGLYKRIIDECVELGIDSIQLNNINEPLLDSRIVERVSYARDVGIRNVMFFTNAQLLKYDKSRELIEAGLTYVVISIDGATKSTYEAIRRKLNYDTVTGNVRSLMRARAELASSTPRINLTFTAIKQNEREVTKFITMWQGKADEVHIGIGHNWAGKQSNVMELKPRVYPCKAPWSSFVINWNGDVAMCCVDYETTVKLGNVQTESVLEIWNGTKLKELRQRHLERNFDGLICKNCPGEATMPWLSWWADK